MNKTSKYNYDTSDLILLDKYETLVWKHLTTRQARCRANCLAALYLSHR